MAKIPFDEDLYEPTYEELSDPNNFFYNPDWWQICENFPEDDYWGKIATALCIATGGISGWRRHAERKPPRLRGRKKRIGEECVPDGEYPNHDLEYKIRTLGAIDLAERNLDRVIQMVSRKHFSSEAVFAWGEFQKAMALLDELGILRSASRRSVNNSKRRNISDAKQWYCLWLEWHRKNKTPPSCKLERLKHFRNYFEGLLQEIRTGKRAIKRNHHTAVLDLIKQLTGYSEDQEEVRLTTAFLSTNFGKTARKKSLEDGKKNKELPPVGEEFYPIKK